MDTKRAVEVGDYARFTVSDPWDFVTDYGSEPFVGKVIDVDQASHKVILICLLTPFIYKGNSVEYLVISTRHVGSIFLSENQACEIPAAARDIAMDQLKSESLTAIARRSGNLNLIGSVSWRVGQV